jgi:hypothetical protein
LVEDLAYFVGVDFRMEAPGHRSLFLPMWRSKSDYHKDALLFTCYLNLIYLFILFLKKTIFHLTFTPADNIAMIHFIMKFLKFYQISCKLL